MEQMASLLDDLEFGLEQKSPAFQQSRLLTAFSGVPYGNAANHGPTCSPWHSQTTTLMENTGSAVSSHVRFVW